MRIELWKSKLHNAQVLNLVFAALATVLAVALVANGFFRQNVAVHVVPINPTQEYWANAMGGDEYYKKSIAMAMLPWIANVTPASVDFHHRQLLQWVPSSHYGLMSESLGAEAVYVKTNNLLKPPVQPIHTKSSCVHRRQRLPLHPSVLIATHHFPQLVQQKRLGCEANHLDLDQKGPLGSFFAQLHHRQDSQQLSHDRSRPHRGQLLRIADQHDLPATAQQQSIQDMPGQHASLIDQDQVGIHTRHRIASAPISQQLVQRRGVLPEEGRRFPGHRRGRHRPPSLNHLSNERPR